MGWVSKIGEQVEIISESHVNGEIHNQIGNLVITCGNGFGNVMPLVTLRLNSCININKCLLLTYNNLYTCIKYKS